MDQFLKSSIQAHIEEELTRPAPPDRAHRPDEPGWASAPIPVERRRSFRLVLPEKAQRCDLGAQNQL